MFISSTFPCYWGFLDRVLAQWAILGEVTYWPNFFLKAIRLLCDERDTGTHIGFLEMGRGTIDVIVASKRTGYFQRLWEKALLHYGEDFSSYPQLPHVPEFSVSFFVPNDEKRTDGKREGQNRYPGCIQRYDPGIEKYRYLGSCS